MTLEDAVKLLMETYEVARADSKVNDPVAWSLYHVWKKADSNNQDKRVYGHWKGNLAVCSVCGHIGYPLWETCIACGAIMDEKE